MPQRDGANIPLTLPASANVKFYYDHETHWMTDNQSSVIAVAPGSFQSELGCPGDWDPSCLRSWLEDPDGDGTYTFETTALPAGSYETKVAINESWDENYGQGGVPGGANIAFSVPADNTKVTFSYVATTHVLTVTVAQPAGAPGLPGRAVPLRSRSQGLRRHGTQHDVQGLVHGGRRRAERRVIPDDRQHQRQVPAVHRHRRQHVHRFAGTGHDVDCVHARRQRHGVPGHDARPRAAPTGWSPTTSTDPARNTVVMSTQLAPLRPGAYKVYVRFDATVNGNGGGGPGNGGADSAVTDTSTGHPIAVSYDTNTATNAANRDYAQPVYAALDGPFTQVTSGFVGTASDGLSQLDADRTLATTYDAADNGNVVQTAGSRRAVDRWPGRHGARVRRQPGGGRQRRRGVARRLLRPAARRATKPAGSATTRLCGRRRRSCPASRSSSRLKLAAPYYLNANVLKASEDKTFPGAIVAGLASPWGQSVPAGDPDNTYFGSYREVFARDLYEAWTGLMADGDLATARAATLFLFERQQQPDGSMPRNSLVNGKLAPDSFGTQLDETSYPLLMAAPAPPHRPHAVHPAHQAGGRTSWPPMALVRRGAMGGAVGLLAVDDRRRDRRPAGRGRPRRRQPRRRFGPRLARRGRRLPALDQGLDGHDQRAARRRRRTSSGCRRPATRTRRSPTTSATAARRSTSAT